MAFKVGLTGGVGSGKSTVAAVFDHLEVPTFNADRIGHRLMRKGESGYDAIIHAFGHAILNDQDEIDRGKLGDIVFANSSLKSKLETMLHPMIMQEIHQLAESTKAPYSILDIPLLIGSSEQNKVDHIVVVKCDIDARIKRIKKRSGWPDEKVLNVINAQLPESTLLEAADDVIDNNGLPNSLEPQVVSLHQKFLSISG